MASAETKKPFARQAFFNHEDLVGARWWQERLQAAGSPVSRRKIFKTVAMLGGAVVAVKIVMAIASDSEVDVSMDTLELQRTQGWDVGHTGQALDFLGATSKDVQEGETWRGELQSLGTLLAPTQASLVPYFVPTLFQVLTSASSNDLRLAVTPVHMLSMDGAYVRGQAIVRLFDAVNMPTDTAVILDIPGTDSVAVAAGMSSKFEPVFVFDNWPHPVGVVPSHLTMGAVLYYLPVFEKGKSTRASLSPPVFVLDSNRLSPYTDAATQFDNRYLAKLPPPDGFKRLGIKHVLYVVPKDGDHEQDDLNEDFVALDDAGIDVKTVALTDFRPAANDPQAAAAPIQPVYYGGHMHSHTFFWYGYSWYSPPAMVGAPMAPADLSRGSTFKPVARQTVFSGRTASAGGRAGFDRARPAGFGQTAVRASKSDGRITGLGGAKATSTSGRSGSFGRSHSSGGFG